MIYHLDGKGCDGLVWDQQRHTEIRECEWKCYVDTTCDYSERKIIHSIWRGGGRSLRIFGLAGGGINGHLN